MAAPLARVLATTAVLAAAAACDSPNEPSDARTVAVFDVAGERFRARLAGPALEAARAAVDGGQAVRIPNGRLVAGAEVNAGYSWHLEDVAFADVTIELCDGRPSDVERAGVAYGGGRYCPWGARLVTLVAP